MNKLSSIWNGKSEGVKSAIVFTLAILVSRGVAFLTTPIFTRIMPTDQIGVVGLYTSSFAILSSITSLALNSGGFMIGMKDFEGQRDQYVSSVLTLTSITSVLALFLFVLFPTFWSELLGLPFGLIMLMGISCVLTPAYEFWLMRQRYEYAYRKAALITILTSVGSTLIAVIAVILLKDFPSSLGEIRLYVAVGSSLLVYFFFWIVQLRKGHVFFNKPFWSSSLALSIPLLGHSFASQILSVSDRLFIGKLVDNAAVGIYSTLYTVGSLALMLWGAINSSFVPYLFQNIENPGNRKNVSKTAIKLLAMFSALTVCVSIITPEITYVLAPAEYLEYVSIVPPIVAGVYFIAVGNLYSNLLVYCKQTWAIMIYRTMTISIKAFKFFTRGVKSLQKMKHNQLDANVNFMLEYHWRKAQPVFANKRQIEQLPDPHGLSGCGLWYMDDDKESKLVGIMIGYNHIDSIMIASRIDLATEIIRKSFDNSIPSSKTIQVEWL